MGTSLGAYFAYVFISSELPFSQVYHTSGAVFTSGIFYLSLALNVLAMFAFDLVNSSL
jgi:phospholipid-translocating ATPase/phospholipid-transporting ATPase